MIEMHDSCAWNYLLHVQQEMKSTVLTDAYFQASTCSVSCALVLAFSVPVSEGCFCLIEVTDNSFGRGRTSSKAGAAPCARAKLMMREKFLAGKLPIPSSILWI